MAVAALSGWTSEQKNVVAASFLGWTLDAFDFFLLVFVLKDIATEFQTDTGVTLAILLTLALRPVGAFIFGRLADRFGRRPILMLDVALYSLIGVGLAPNLTVLICPRPVRRGHGRGVGHRGLAHHGDRPAQGPRPCLGSAAIGVPDRLPLASSSTAAFSLHRLARHVHDRLAPRAAGAVYPPACAGIAELGKAEPAQRGGTLGPESHWQLCIMPSC